MSAIFYREVCCERFLRGSEKRSGVPCRKRAQTSCLETIPMFGTRNDCWHPCTSVLRISQVGVLKSIAPVNMDNVVLGQYVGTDDGSKPGYKDGELGPVIAIRTFRRHRKLLFHSSLVLVNTNDCPCVGMVE